MRIPILIVTVLVFSSHTPYKAKWVIDSSSKLLINGNTNVNKFTCQTSYVDQLDTLEILPGKNDCDIVFSQKSIAIPVKDFSCGNQMITKDFWETLKANKHPHIGIHFLTLKEFTTVPNGGVVEGDVEITLAGVKKRFTISYQLNRTAKDVFTLRGIHPMCFSDFQLETPRKMMGLIQVQENLDVEFLLKLKVLP